MWHDSSDKIDHERLQFDRDIKESDRPPQVYAWISTELELELSSNIVALVRSITP